MLRSSPKEGVKIGTILLKKTILATALAFTCGTALASDYFVVVPVPGKTVSTAAIDVSLAGYTLPAGLVGSPYAGFNLSTLLSVTGDPGYTGSGVTWAVVGGSLPAGVTLNKDGSLSGTLTAPGTASFQVRASYKTKTGEQAYQIVVANLTVGLAASTPPSALVGQSYTYDLKPLLTVTGDSAYTSSNVTWSVVSSTLPAGTGAITARASYKGVNGEQTYQVVVLQIVVRLNAATPPEAAVGSAYSYDLKPLLAVYGDPSFQGAGVSWDISQGSLPAGLSLTSDGVISGTPSAASSGPVTVRATYKNAQGQQVYQLVALDIKITLDGGTPPQAIAGTPYLFDLKTRLTVSGDPNFTNSSVSWALTGTLPTGLSFSPNGIVSGTPAVADPVGTSFNVQASYKSKTGQQTYTLTVGNQVLTVTQISAGAYHTCAVTSAGGVKCWGYNLNGQIGDNSTTIRLIPVDVVGLTSGVSRVVTGYNYTCALTTSGGVKCWGANQYGQLGNSSTANSLVPVDVAGLSAGVASLTAGSYHMCAVTTAGGAKCWGYNQYGQLGNNNVSNSLAPTDVVGLTSGVASIAGGMTHTCAVTVTGGAKCWGRNNYGQLGNGRVVDSLAPVDVAGLTAGVAQISAGDYHSCAITTNGGALCWGYNGTGQLGGNGTTDSKYPVSVSGVTSSGAAIGAGSNHSCVLTKAGGVKCWGFNYYGELGNNSTSDSATPVDVSGLTSGVARLAVGNDYNCVLTSDGGAKCLGNGGLGDNSIANSKVPVSIVKNF